MLKVFLVEDEYIIREAIRKTVNWEKEGYELVGEAGDGERAYPLILNTQPDILITDIRMPFMNGLELSRLVSKNLPAAKIIILSGYDDFSYAREAISIGVTDYLLKPVSGAKLLESMKRVGESIEEERKQKSYRDIYEAEHEERLKLEKSRFLMDIIDGKLTITEILDKSKELGKHMTAVMYKIILFQSIPTENADPGVEDARNGLMSLIEESIFRSGSTEYYELVGGSLCIMLSGNDAETIASDEKEIMNLIRSRAAEKKDEIYFTASGPVVDRITEIGHSYEMASKLFARRFMCEKSHEFYASDEGNEEKPDDGTDISGETEARMISDADEVDLSTLQFWKTDRTILMNFLRSGTEDDIGSFVEAMINDVGRQNLDSFMLRQYILMDVYLTVSTFLEALGYPKEQIEEACGNYKELLSLDSPEKMADYLKKSLAQTLKLRADSSETHSVTIISEAQKYILEHYSDNELSLSTIADAIGMSPTHLSHVFSKETGNTLVEYITNVRMESAKVLLRSTNQTSAEIGMNVGYSDPHYFYYIFKKTQNVTPKEFRNSGMQARGDEE